MDYSFKELGPAIFNDYLLFLQQAYKT